MPQTTGCALTHRLPSNTTTAARPPADLPPLPVEEGRGGVRLHTANAKSPAVLLPPPWGRIGVGAAKKRTATKPHQTSSFTYIPSAQAYVKKTIGCALGRVCNSNFPPLRCGGGAGRGCENRVATAFKTKCKQPLGRVCISVDKPLSLWDKHCSRSDKYCLRSKRGVGVRAAIN